jgi:hypothetical protein
VDEVVPSRRHSGGFNWAVAVTVVVVVMGAVVAFGAQGVASPHVSSHVSESRRATCVAPGTKAGSSVRWFTDYRVVTERQATSIELGKSGNESSGRTESTTGPQPWVASWLSPNGVTSQARAFDPGSGGTRFPTGRLQLLAPGGKCILYLSAHPVPSHRVAVIGDSVFANIAHAVAQNALGKASYSRDWQIVATSGYGWNASPVVWPLGVLQGGWVLDSFRGLAASRPSALVVELGANDALRAVFDSSTSNPAQALSVLAGVFESVGNLIEDAADQVPCTVLVTVPTSPTLIFGAGQPYVTQAELVNEAIRVQADKYGPSVRVADWAALSAAHHSTTGTQDWFTGDNVHPNRTGESALVSLVHRTLLSCPASSTVRTQ